MTMKTGRYVATIISGVLLTAPALLFAQDIGLRIADTAESRHAGQFEVTPGAVWGEDISFYGARETYVVSEDLRAFLDLGLIDSDGSNLDLGGQLGVVAPLPGIEYIGDLAARATIYYANTDAQDTIGTDLMLVSSSETLLDGLFLYGGVGIDISHREEEYSSSGRLEINPALSIGLMYRFNDSVGVYLEASHVDGASFGAGVQIR